MTTTPQRHLGKVLRTPGCRLLPALLFALGGLLPSSKPALAGGLEDIQAAGVIRVCADPHNLPFSDMGMAPAGYELDIAAEIARDLDVRLDYLWFHTAYGGRVLRQLYEHRCDFFMGLPSSMAASAPRLLLTRPYLRTGFVAVVRSDSPIRSLEDAREEKVGVEMMTVADFHLFRKGYGRDLYRSQEALFQALESGRVNAAMMWLPVAAWSLKQHPAAGLKLLPVSDPTLEFSLAIGVRKEDPELRARLDQTIERLRSSGTLERIWERYGLQQAEGLVR